MSISPWARSVLRSSFFWITTGLSLSFQSPPINPLNQRLVNTAIETILSRKNEYRKWFLHRKHIHTSPILTVSQAIYLGITINSNLSNITHINKAINHARRWVLRLHSFIFSDLRLPEIGSIRICLRITWELWVWRWISSLPRICGKMMIMRDDAKLGL